MEQPCYKCGQPVDEGTPFFAHCSAPQIRVVVAEPDATMLPATADGTPALSGSQTVPVLAVPMHWSQALRPCILAAFASSLLVALGLNPFVAMLSAGFLSVVFYRQRLQGVPIKIPVAMGLGALGGLLWFAISSIFEAVVVIVFHKGAELRTELLKKIDQAASQATDPQVLAIFDRFRTPAGLEFLMITGLIAALVAAVVLGSLGGLISGAIFGRGNRS